MEIGLNNIPNGFIKTGNLKYRSLSPIDSAKQEPTNIISDVCEMRLTEDDGSISVLKFTKHYTIVFTAFSIRLIVSSLPIISAISKI